MAQHIAQMVYKGSPQAIERYVKNHLPSDMASLERIYKQLVQYHPSGQNKKVNKMPNKSQSVSTLTQRKKGLQRKEQNITIEKKRTQSLIKLLREKGFKPNNVDQEQGLSKYIAHKQRLTKPHITNHKLLKSQQAIIDKLIDRYTINSKYYNNEINDARLDLQTLMDPEMKEFMERRNIVLESFKNKTNPNMTKQSKFTTISCRVYQKSERKLSFQKMQSMKDTSSTFNRLTPTMKIMEQCMDQIKEQKFKDVKLNENYYSQVKKKIECQILDLQDQIQQISNFKKNHQKIQFQRYTNSYMKMMNNKLKQGSKCKLSNYAKDLLRDERKMRNIIDFANK